MYTLFYLAKLKTLYESRFTLLFLQLLYVLTYILHAIKTHI